MVSQRGFAHRAFVTAIGLALALLMATPPARAVNPGDIEHVIVVMMENRSFDHLLGWLPPPAMASISETYNTEADGTGTDVSNFDLAPDYQRCLHPDPGHSYKKGRVEYNSGAIDGFLFPGSGNDEYAVGYYQDAPTQTDLDFFGQAALEWTVLDNMFASIMAGTWPNKFFSLAADTDRTGSITPIPFPSQLPTIYDKLLPFDQAALAEGRYYYSDAPFSALWGDKYLSISYDMSQFFTDAAAGTLAEVSFVDPRFLGAQVGTSCDDHPKADIRCGQDYLNQVYQAVITGPDWGTSVLVITYDEWGGFYDSVVPSVAPLAPVQSTIDTGDANGPAGLRGFRIPTLVISPWAPRGNGVTPAVASALYDHTSILKMIEWNWGLTPLTNRDQNANNLADVLTGPQNLTASTFVVGTPPPPTPCPAPSAEQWLWLCRRAAFLGFQTPCSAAIPAMPPSGWIAVVALVLAAGVLALRRLMRAPRSIG